MWNNQALIDTAQVEIDELIYGTAMQQPQDFSDAQARRYRADEGGSDSFASEKRDAALVQLAVRQELRVGGTLVELEANLIEDLQGQEQVFDLEVLPEA